MSPEEAKLFVDKVQAGYPVSREDIEAAAQWMRVRLERKERDRYDADKRAAEARRLGHVR
jgi:uncharacterized protein (DUF433 family)